MSFNKNELTMNFETNVMKNQKIIDILMKVIEK